MLLHEREELCSSPHRLTGKSQDQRRTGCEARAVTPFSGRSQCDTCGTAAVLLDFGLITIEVVVELTDARGKVTAGHSSSRGDMRHRKLARNCWLPLVW